MEQGNSDPHETVTYLPMKMKLSMPKVIDVYMMGGVSPTYDNI